MTHFFLLNRWCNVVLCGYCDLAHFNWVHLRHFGKRSRYSCLNLQFHWNKPWNNSISLNIFILLIECKNWRPEYNQVCWYTNTLRGLVSLNWLDQRTAVDFFYKTNTYELKLKMFMLSGGLTRHYFGKLLYRISTKAFCFYLIFRIKRFDESYNVICSKYLNFKLRVYFNSCNLNLRENPFWIIF